MECWSDGVMIFSKPSTPILHHSNTPWFWCLRVLRVLRDELTSILGLATALWLSGCLLGPDYNRPSVEIPPQFRAAMTPEALPSIADLKWFEVFRDEHLQELIRVALVQNYDLRDAIARVDQARGNLGITRSNQFPNFNLGGDVTSRELSTNGEFSIPPGATFVNRQRTFGEGFVSLLSFEVDIWGRLRRATESAQAQLLASDWNRKTVITTLISDVATAYFNLLELDMELVIARDTLGTRDESLRLLRIQLQGGVGTLLDVRQGEQLVNTAAEVIPDDERQIEQTENQISLLLGKNPGPVARSSLIAMERPPPEVPAGLTSVLLERRPEIQAAEQILIAYVPQLTQPIFTAGRLGSQVELAEAQERSALAQYENAIQTGFRDVSNALIQYQKIREIRTLRESLVTVLRDRKRLAYMRFRGGVDTMLNALNSDQDLFTAELSLAQVRRDELLSLVQLYKALGGGWQE